MPGYAANPDQIENESKRWRGLADQITDIRKETEALGLGFTAFFPGGMLQVGLHSKYRELLEEAVHRFRGAAIEFELIGVTLRNIAKSYEQQEEVTANSFRVTEEELQQATESHSPTPPADRGRQRYY